MLELSSIILSSSIKFDATIGKPQSILLLVVALKNLSDSSQKAFIGDK